MRFNHPGGCQIAGGHLRQRIDDLAVPGGRQPCSHVEGQPPGRRDVAPAVASLLL